MSTKQTAQSITQGDFCIGLVLAMFLRGLRSFYPDRYSYTAGAYAWHLSMWQAYGWLKYSFHESEDRISFRIRPHPLHGRSQAVADEMYSLMMLRMTHTWSSGNGSYELTITPEDAENLLARNGIPRELLDELASRFVDEYEVPAVERTWPPDFDMSRLGSRREPFDD